MHATRFTSAMRGTALVRHHVLGLFSPLGLDGLTGSFVAEVTSFVSFLVKGPRTFPLGGRSSQLDVWGNPHPTHSTPLSPCISSAPPQTLPLCPGQELNVARSSMSVTSISLQWSGTPMSGPQSRGPDCRGPECRSTHRAYRSVIQILHVQYYSVS